MTPVKVRVEFCIQFASSFHMGTGMRRTLIHRTIARKRDGSLVIPGSTVKGVLRARCEQIASMFNLQVIEPHVVGATALAATTRTIVDDVFGSRFSPGTLFFDDLSLDPDQEKFFGSSRNLLSPLEQSELRTRIALSRKTGAAKTGHLFTSENGYRGLKFTGTVYGFLQPPIVGVTGLPYSLVLLVAGMTGLDRLGSGRSIGIGECTVTIASITVAQQRYTKEAVLQSIQELEYYDLEVTN